MGGVVVAEIFSNLRKPSRFSGGGVVAQFSVVSKSPRDFSGGGVEYHTFSVNNGTLLHFLPFSKGPPP